jgi:Tol biopolymer transport system component
LPGTTLNLGPGAWSPDGRGIAVQSWDEAHPDRDGMYLIDSDEGGHRVRLTKERDGVNHLPSDFSPDGTHLVFLEEHTDTEGAGQLPPTPDTAGLRSRERFGALLA